MYEFKSKDYFTNGLDLFVNKHIKDTSYCVGPHIHDFAELAYIYSGNGSNIFGGRNYPLHKGVLLFINYNQSHEIKVDSEILQCDILLSPRFISRELVNTDNFLDILTLSQYSGLSEYTELQLPYLCLAGKELMLVESLFDRITEEFAEKQLGFESIIRGCLQIIISIMIRQLTGAANASAKIPQDILDYIDNNYNEKLTAEMLSEKCFYNPAYFGRVFHECFGMSFKDYIRKRRIDEAIKLLQDTDMPIEQIINRVGYTNRTEFYRVFVEQCGRTPADVRSGSPAASQNKSDEP